MFVLKLSGIQIYIIYLFRRDLLHACVTSSLDQAETLKNSLLAETVAMQKVVMYICSSEIFNIQI